MNKSLIFLIIAFIGFNCNAQNEFQKGYFIDKNNNKVECLIKNSDWNNNPSSFQYKLSKNSNVVTGNVASIKEFEILNSLKFIRASVEIDISSSKYSNLTKNRAPVFETKTLFLKTLVEGNASLFSYKIGTSTRYFYSKSGGEITQLIYKKFLTTSGRMSSNEQFKQQLKTELTCSNDIIKNPELVNYDKSSLTNYFIQYNECNNANFKSYKSEIKGRTFNFSIRPRLNNSSFSIVNESQSNLRDADFGNNSSFGIGIEGELTLPVNNNKWALFIEPTFQSFKSESTKEAASFFGDSISSSIDYSSIEVPIGVRHYLYLSQKSKLFVNAAFVIDLVLNSSITYDPANDSTIEPIEIQSAANLAVGLGYKFNNKYSAEIRYQSSRNLASGFVNLDSKYETTSFIIGYSIF